MKLPAKITCITCPLGCSLVITKSQAELIVSGNKCPRGKKYALEEITSPKRIITTTVKISGSLAPVVSVKTAQPAPKEKIFTIMNILANVKIKAPIHLGEVVVKNIAATGIDVIATKTLDKKD